MEDKIKRVLFVNSMMTPFIEDGEIAEYCRTLAQGIQEQKVEIRSFVPRYGLINERKNQLHEVIRLSGMNVIIIGNVDRPLIIKVASLPSARMQVYFIDNEDYFRRKAIYTDENGVAFKDNGERAIFYARGVMETVKKLRWSPDIIHCSGWISHLIPLFLKKFYKDDPIFADSKVVISAFDDVRHEKFSESFASTVAAGILSSEDISPLSTASYGINLAKMALRYTDGLIIPGKKYNAEMVKYAKSRGIPVLDFDPAESDSQRLEGYKSFYGSLK